MWDYNKICRIPRIHDSRTTVYQGVITTNASVLLKYGFPETYSMTYKTRNEKRVFILYMWRGEDDHSTVLFEMP
jgi:hypothetical protein